jgi:FkbM family methyltransferase
MNAKDSAQESPFVRAYAALNKHIKILETPVLREAFLATYFAYKRFVEDPFAKLLAKHPNLLGQGDIYDVGANLGYTSNLFLKWSTANVHAFEPESTNFRILSSLHSRHPRFKAVQAAVGAHNGEISLSINQGHHADHKIDPSGKSKIKIPLYSLDEYWQKNGENREISFVKIDVQGYEPPVIEGMQKLLTQFPHMNIALEYDYESLTALGFNPDDFLKMLFHFPNRELKMITANGKLNNLTLNMPELKTGYWDLLWAPKG